MFDPFFTMKGLEGTGLRLWVSQGIIDRHGGRLQLRSSMEIEQHGTVFRIFLPFETVQRSEG
jgi:signal transduction histidine kinase